jgi:hypothetical protein
MASRLVTGEGRSERPGRSLTQDRADEIGLFLRVLEEGSLKELFSCRSAAGPNDFIIIIIIIAYLRISMGEGKIQDSIRTALLGL